LLHEEEVGGIDGVRVCRNAPSVSHLLFADDSLILMKADMNNATSLQRVLDEYCANSGQMVSLTKSSIFFPLILMCWSEQRCVRCYILILRPYQIST
jgi:hypothetical protein